MPEKPADLSEYSTKFNEALDHYFEQRYEAALAVFTALQSLPGLDKFQQATLLRRIANCKSYLQPTAELLDIYDHALGLVGDMASQRLWILASKAHTLSLLHRYSESLHCYTSAMELADDPDELDHLEYSVKEVISEQERYVKYGDYSERKKQILDWVAEKQKEVDKAEFWKSAEGKKIIED